MIDRIAVKNSLWMLFSFGGKSIIQLFYFAIIARVLGASGYGRFISVVALISIFSPFVNWGAGNLLIRHIANEKAHFSSIWGKTLVISFSSAFIISVLSFVVSEKYFGSSVDYRILLLIIASDLIMSRFVDLFSQVFQAFERLRETSIIQITFNIARLLAAIFLLVLPVEKSVLNWAIFYFIPSVLVSCYSFHRVTVFYGYPNFSKMPHLQDFKEGGFFSFSLSAQTVYNDIDKVMLAKIINTEASGIYTAAYRIIDVAFIPMKSVLYAIYSRFFASGKKNPENIFFSSLKLLPASILISLSAILLTLFLSPYLKYIFGGDFVKSSEIVIYLSPIIILKSLHYIAADALTGANFQKTRTIIQIAIAIANVAANIILIPPYGIKGAVIVSISCDFMLVVSLWLVLYLKTHSRRADVLQ